MTTTAQEVTKDIHMLSSYVPVPNFGLIPVNAYVLLGREPALVDTGLIPERENFIRALKSVIDPAELKWIYLTHPDPDHIGSLQAVAEAAPQARVITTFVGFGILSITSSALPPDRVYFLNPGEKLAVGDRTIHVLKPPSFDNPATTAFYDERSRTLVSSDYFGAVLQTPALEAREISAEDLRAGQLLWGTLDAPWVHKVERSRYAADVASFGEASPELVLSAHLPPARGMTDRLLANLSALPEATPFAGPNQAAFEEALRGQTTSAETAAV